MKTREFKQYSGGFRMAAGYLSLPEIFYKKLAKHSFPKLKMVICNDALAEKLGLDPAYLHSEEGLQKLSGGSNIGDFPFYAQAYAGHQFGYFTMLGDGRAKNLGEHQDPQGEVWDIQLKGSGKTPFSRGGDGKAVLGPMLREYIISEAMAGLKIPTTRALAIMTTGENIRRQRWEKGAILVRVAKSHLRVGSFQYAAMEQKPEDVKVLADYAIRCHDEDLLQKDYSAEVRGALYLEFFRRVIRRQAGLIAQWQNVGFVHGVMNTDNMTISGETIDYGPCAFMDTYHPDTVFSSIDEFGRYAYGNQPEIALWNLCRLGDCLVLLIGNDREEAVELLNEELKRFPDLYQQYYRAILARKLGFDKTNDEIDILAESLLDLMQDEKLDFTNTFKDLTCYLWALNEAEEPEQCPDNEKLNAWREKWLNALKKAGISLQEAMAVMQEVNPCIIPRNFWVEEVLAAAVQGDTAPLYRMLELLKDPYAYSKEQLQEAAGEIVRGPYVTYCGT